MVVVLATDDEHRMQRSWDLGFLAPVHGANCPEVRFNRYVPAAEVREVLAEIHPPVAPAAAPLGLAPAPARSWWQRLLGR